MDIKHTTSETRSHLTTIIAVHAQRATLAQSFVPVRELTKTSSGKDRRISRLEMSVDDQTTIVNKAVVVDALEDIGIDITMTTGDENTSL